MDENIQQGNYARKTTDNEAKQFDLQVNDFLWDHEDDHEVFLQILKTA